MQSHSSPIGVEALAITIIALACDPLTGQVPIFPITVRLGWKDTRATGERLQQATDRKRLIPDLLRRQANPGHAGEEVDCSDLSP